MRRHSSRTKSTDVDPTDSVAELGGGLGNQERLQRLIGGGGLFRRWMARGSEDVAARSGENEWSGGALFGARGEWELPGLSAWRMAAGLGVDASTKAPEDPNLSVADTATTPASSAPFPTELASNSEIQAPIAEPLSADLEKAAPELLAPLAASQDTTGASSETTTPSDRADKPEWMSTHLWERYSANTYGGVNPTLVMRKYSDGFNELGEQGRAYLKGAFHIAFDSKVAHYSGNGASRNAAIQTVKEDGDYLSYLSYGFPEYAFGSGSDTADGGGLGFGHSQSTELIAETAASPATAPAAEAPPTRPEWMSTHLWERYSANTYGGVNPTLVMRKYSDGFNELGEQGRAYLKGAFHIAFDSKVAHYSGNGASRNAAIQTVKEDGDYLSYLSYGFPEYAFGSGSDSSGSPSNDLTFGG